MKKGHHAPRGAGTATRAQAGNDGHGDELRGKADEESDVSGVDGLNLPMREEVLRSCLVVSGGIGAAAAGWRAIFPESVFPIIAPDEPRGAFIGLGVGGVVTAARWLLRSAWPQFAKEGDESNRTALANLNPLDVVIVALVPAWSEEAAFRASLQPTAAALTGSEIGSILLVGVVFGILHAGGGRRAAFIAWASAVGCLYGSVGMFEGDALAPAVAHGTANLASGFAWKLRNDS